MDDNERAKAERLILAATAMLEYVKDPGERPPSTMTLNLVYREPESLLKIAQRQVADMERQSQVVRALKASLAEWGQ